MRPILLLLLILSSLLAAEAPPAPKPKPLEVFTLTDNRKLTGTYDEDAGVLTLEGGKASLPIKPEQIASRAPAKPADVLNPDTGPAPTAKPMTPEEKAAAVEAFKAAQATEGRRKLLAEADKLDREADRLTEQAASRREQAARDAKAFKARCEQEGTSPSTKAILGGPVSSKKTGASNGGILGLIETATKLEASAKEARASAATKRAAAAAPAAEPAPAATP